MFEVSGGTERSIAERETAETVFPIEVFSPANKGHFHMTTEHTTTWPDLAIGLYDRLTGRKAEIVYEFADMHIQIPAGTGAQAERAEWVLNGVVKVRTGEAGQLPN